MERAAGACLRRPWCGRGILPHIPAGDAGVNPAIPVSNTRDAAASGGFPRLIARLTPGILLPAALGYAGKFTEQSIAAYGEGAPHGAA